MKTIYKYPLEFRDVQELSLPSNSSILDIQFQNGNLTLWALVDTEQVSTDKFIINVVGTGFAADHLKPEHYRKTVQEANGQLVWHIFIAKEPGGDYVYS